MHRLQKPNALRIAATFAVIFAWVFASNQCAFAGPGAAAEKEHSHAAAPHSHGSGHEHGGHEHGPGGGGERDSDACCQSLQIPALSVEKPPVQFDPSAFSRTLDFAVVLREHAPAPLVAIQADDTGPPGLISFAESVLQRSLLAHAPPSLG